MKKILLISIVVLLIASFGVAWKLTKKEAPASVVTNFEECIAAGNPVMESYPRQCRDGEETYVENIGNELQKFDLIRITSPRPNQSVQSPITITGEARGNWFFEASFPVFLTDWDGKIIAQGIATAKSNWMTADFVPFEATLTFTVDKNAYSNKGTLILRKDNPSGLSEHDDSIEIPVILNEVVVSPKACTQEAKLCPDGSYVARTGPNCEFALCPSTQKSCQKDSDCDSGNLCHKNICTSPIGRQCVGPTDQSCPMDFECVQSCGPPVVRYPDDTPATYFCQLKGYIRNCPICLAKNTLIDTPLGAVAVQDLKKGAPVWTVNNFGKRVPGVVILTNKTRVSLDHKMVELVFDDGHALQVSPGHPTIDGRTADVLVPGDMYNGAQVITSRRLPYRDGYTYDILVSGETGFYFANGILLDSTLH